MDERDVAARLTAERASVAQRIAFMSDDLAAVVAAAAGSNLDDEHDPEGSTVAFEREQLAALRSQAEAHLLEVDAALERLRNGEYGRCAGCARAIGEARLDALPATHLCLTCAAKRRRRST